MDIRRLKGSKIGVVGAGKIGKKLIQMIQGPHLRHLKMQILGVSDLRKTAPGYRFAVQSGVFTSRDYRDLFKLEDLSLLVELTGKEAVARAIRADLPPHIRLIDHHQAMLFYDVLTIEAERIRHIHQLEESLEDPRRIRRLFNGFARKIGGILKERTAHLQDLEREILEREQILSQIIDGSTIPTFVIDQNHRVTHWNRAMERLTGYKAETMIGTRRQWEPFWDSERSSMADVILDQIPESQMERLYGKSWRRSALIEGAYEAEVFFPKLGENGKWCYFTAAPIKDAEGNLIGAIETLWDTSEQKEAREKLKEYAERLEDMVREATAEIERRSDFQEKLIRSSNDGIIATDEKGIVIIYNEGAQRIFGYAPEEILNRATIETLYPPEIRNQVRLGLGKIGDVNLSQWREVTVVSESGEAVPTRFSGAILFQGTAVIGSVCFFRDLREIKRLQKDLIQSERLAAMGQTIAGLAHSIKNILYGLKGGVYVFNRAVEKDDTEKIKDGWRMIERNIQRISDLVMDLLMYSKERLPEPEDCSPNAIVRDVCSLVADLAKAHNITLIQDLDPAVGRAHMDPRAVHRILLDLVNNAIDACLFDMLSQKKWTVTVSTALLKNGMIQFQVSDNGIGMDQETLENLFTRLFSSKGQKGTGLGLLVTEKLVKENGGAIYVASELGKGSTFTVHLPYRALKENGKPEHE